MGYGEIANEAFEIREKNDKKAFHKICDKAFSQALTKYPDLIFKLMDQARENGIKEGKRQLQKDLRKLLND